MKTSYACASGRSTLANAKNATGEISLGSATSNTIAGHTTAEAVIADIQSGKWAKQISALRAATGDKAATLKKNLPAILPAGTFTTRKNDGIIKFSGFLCADIDKVPERIGELHDTARLDPHGAGAFVSPSGTGLKILFRVPVAANAKQHHQNFIAVRAHVAKIYGVVVDEKTGDVARLCFVSHDPAAFYKAEAVPLPVLYVAEAKPSPQKDAPRFTDSLSSRSEIATKLLGEIQWENDTKGFARCPGQHLHTSGNGEKDFMVLLDGVPSLKCFHNSCGGIVTALNHELRSQIGRAEWEPLAATASSAGHPGDEGEEKIPPFPLQHLPPAARAMAEAIARTERTPETLAGCCVLGFLSASIGAGLQVRSGPDRFTRGNLYLMPSAESGSGKSETFRHTAKPFHEFERDMVKRWLTDTGPKVETEVAILESRIKQLTVQAGKAADAIEREGLRGELEQAKAELVKAKANCIAPALCCEDVTSERLAVLLANNQEQLASLSPDAGSIVNNLLGRYSKLDRTDEGIYLKAFSGDYCRVDRQGREPVLLHQPCLAALWLVQPDKVETLLAERSLTDGGMIPRLLPCHTRAQPRPIVDGAEGIPAATANAWAMLVGKLIHAFRMAGEPFTIDPTPEARQMMKEHHNRIVERRLGELRDVTTYAARWNEQAWRVAVCLHAGLHGEDAGGRMLAADTAASAIALSDWFAGEQLRILARGRHAARRAKLDEVLALLADNPSKGITARDVYRARIVGSADEARTLLAQMETDRELTHREAKPEGGGHVTLIYTKARK